MIDIEHPAAYRGSVSPMVPLPPSLHLLPVTVEKSGREERRGDQKNSDPTDYLKFFSLLPNREDEHWSAGGSWLRGDEEGDSSSVVSEHTHVSFFLSAWFNQSSIFTSTVSYGVVGGGRVISMQHADGFSVHV